MLRLVRGEDERSLHTVTNRVNTGKATKYGGARRGTEHILRLDLVRLCLLRCMYSSPLAFGSSFDLRLLQRRS